MNHARSSRPHPRDGEVADCSYTRDPWGLERTLSSPGPPPAPQGCPLPRKGVSPEGTVHVICSDVPPAKASRRAQDPGGFQMKGTKAEGGQPGPDGELTQ